MTMPLDEIGSEAEWHDFLQESMERAGWHVKHEVTCNEDSKRCDFLCYHSKLNGSYSEGEWVGIECKYDRGGYDSTVAAARQIDTKYRSKTWLSSGESVDLWAVAPYTAHCHRGDKREMYEARAKQIAYAEILAELGFGYLFSWHPSPGIAFDSRDVPEIEYTGEDRKYISTPGFPAFECSSRLNPWKNYHSGPGGELDEAADYVRVRRELSGMEYDHDLMTDVWEKHYRDEVDADD